MVYHLISGCVLIIALWPCEIMSMLGRSTQKYLEVKGIHLCNLLSDSSEKCVGWGRIKQMGQNVNGTQETKWEYNLSINLSLSIKR